MPSPTYWSLQAWQLQVSEGGAGVARAPVVEVLPDEPVLRLPAPTPVEAEVHLGNALARRQSVDRSPDEQVERAAACAVGDERGAAAIDSELRSGSVDVDSLRGAGRSAASRDGCRQRDDDETAHHLHCVG